MDPGQSEMAGLLFFSKLCPKTRALCSNISMDAYEKAIKLLAIREHTERELRRKLSDKGYPNSDVDEAISRLLEEGSLSEQRFAESYVRSRLRKSPEGKSVLRMRLKEKGTPSSVADEVLAYVWDNGLYLKPLAVYYSQLQRKKGEEGARVTLLRKGFSDREIREALSSDSTVCE